MEFWGDNFLSQQIFPGMYARKANKIMAKFREKIYNAQVDNIKTKDLDELTAQIKSDIEKQSERKKGLEEKVKAILFSISVSITAITFALSYEKPRIGGAINILSLSIVVLSILYFIASAIISVKTLVPIPIFQVRSEFDYDSNRNVISVFEQEKKEYYQGLVIAKWSNDSSIDIISNLTYTALKLLRNGLILFLVYFAVALIDKKLYSNHGPDSSVSSKIHISINDSISVEQPYVYKKYNDSISLEFGIPVVTKMKQQKPKLAKPITSTPTKRDSVKGKR